VKNIAVQIVSLAVVLTAGRFCPAQEPTNTFTIADVYRARGFFPAGAEEVFPVDSATMLKNFTSFSKGVEDVRVTEEGSLKFRVTADKVTLYWGNQGNTQPLAERINLWSAAYDIKLQVHQSNDQESTWSLRFWSEDRRERPRKDRSKCTDIPLKGTDEETLTFKRNVRFIYRAPSPDGLDVVIENAKGSDIEITSMKLVRKVNKGCFRKEITVPKGKIWRAVAAVSTETALYVNGREIADKTVKTPRPYPYVYFVTRSVDLKPYLKAGSNCIAIEGRQVGRRPCVYIQGRIVMKDGSAVNIESDETWRWNKESPEGCRIAGFDDSQWLNVVDEKSAADLKVDTVIREKRIQKSAWLPAYDGTMVLTSPHERSLFYADSEPVIVNVGVPPGFKRRQPALEWQVKKVTRDLEDNVHIEPASQGNADQFQASRHALVCKLDLGRLDRGVYTLQTTLKLAGEIHEVRIPEPFVVVGKIPMRQSSGDSYEQDMGAKLETTIDFTDPNDPYPWLETDATIKGPKGDYLKTIHASRKHELKAIITTKNGLKYRETRPRTSAQFSYKVEFEHPGDFYLMVLEYPDDQERWMGVSCSSRWRGITAYSKIGPSVVTGWKYPVSNTMKEMKWIYRPEPGSHAINVMSLKNMPAAAARLRIYHIADGLPELKGARSGERLFGLLTENTNPRNSFGYTFSVYGSKVLSDIATAKDRQKNYYSETGPVCKLDTQPLLYVCKSLASWLDTSEAYTKYLRFTGQNVHFIGDYQYWDRLGQTTYMPVPDISTSRILHDMRDVAVRVFRENGIAFISAVEFIRQSALREEPCANMNTTQLLLGGETLYLVDKDGQQKNTWNFLHPRVEEMMLRIAGEIADKWQEQPNFLGESWLSYLGGGFSIPVYRLGRGSDALDASYDDATMKRFEQDTGVDVPETDDPRMRFARRYEFLTSDRMRERWIDWRCEKVKDLYVRLRDTMQKRRKDLVCYLPLYIDVGHADEWKQSGLSLHDYLRRSGWDVEALKGVDDLWVAHWMYAHAKYKRSRGGFGYEASFEMSVGKDFYDLFDSEKGRTQMNMHHWNEIERVTAAMPMRDGWAYPYQSTMQVQANGYYANEVFTQGLIGGDPELVMFGFSHVSLMGGNEQPMREFTRVLRALPREKFRPVLGTGFRTNLAIRELRKGGRLLFYVANPGYWPIGGEIVVDGVDRVSDLVLGEPVDVRQDGKRAVVPVDLKPYGVRAFVADSRRARIVSWSNDPVPDKELAHMRGLIAKGRRVPSIRGVAGKADNDLLNGDYAGAWSLITDWKHWAFVQNEAVYKDGDKIEIKGKGNTLSSVAEDVGDPDVFSYDETTRTASTPCDIVVGKNAELTLGVKGDAEAGQTLEVVCDPEGKRSSRAGVTVAGTLNLYHSSIIGGNSSFRDEKKRQRYRMQRGISFYRAKGGELIDSRIGSASCGVRIYRGAKVLIRNLEVRDCAYGMQNDAGGTVYGLNVADAPSGAYITKSMTFDECRFSNSVLRVNEKSGPPVVVTCTDCELNRDRVWMNAGPAKNRVVIQWRQFFRVKDSKGRALPGVCLRVSSHTDGDDLPSRTATTDEHGEAWLAVPECVIVEANGKACQSVACHNILEIVRPGTENAAIAVKTDWRCTARGGVSITRRDERRFSAERIQYKEQTGGVRE